MPVRSSPAKGRKREARAPAGPTPLSLDEVDQAVKRLGAPAGTDRYAAGKSLIVTAEQFPTRVYPYFHSLAALLSSDSKIVRWNAIRVLSLLAAVDTEGRIDHLLDRYLAPIQGGNMITAANAIQGAARIAAAKPHLLARIVPAILAVEHATYETPECLNVAIGHALDALKALWPSVCNSRQVQALIQRQTCNTRTGAAKRARALLAKLPPV